MPPANRPTTASLPIVVHETHRPPAPALRYIDQVVGSQPAVSFRYSQSVLTQFDIDVVHVADAALDAILGTSGAPSLLRLLAAMLFTRNVRRHGIALVRTIHRTDAPLISSPMGRFSRRLLDRVTSRFVVLDRTTSTPDPGRTVVIRHAHYRERFVGFPRGKQVQGRILCISQGKLPDDVRGVIGAARVVNTPDATLRLAGTVSRSLEPQIRSALARHSSFVSARLEQLSDGAQVDEMAAAELIVVPRVGSYADEQLIFLALSLDRAVVTPRSTAMTELADEIGPGWLHLSDGPITAEAIDTAIASLRNDRTSTSPNLEGRDLTSTHAMYAELFRSITSAV